MKTIDQRPQAPAESRAPASTDAARPVPTSDTIQPQEALDASRDVLLAIKRVLAGDWGQARPRIAVADRHGVDTVSVSTAAHLDPQARADVRGAVRAALAPYARRAPLTDVVFLTRREV